MTFKANSYFRYMRNSRWPSLQEKMLTCSSMKKYEEFFNMYYFIITFSHCFHILVIIRVHIYFNNIKYKVQDYDFLRWHFFVDSYIYTREFASDVEILEAKYRNMFMVSVELPSSTGKWSTADTVFAYGYEISLSNDRQSFGESVNIIIYDESCYTCNSTSVTCTVLVCFYIKCYL